MDKETVDKYGWHRESDPNKIYYDFHWQGDTLVQNMSKNLQSLPREEAVSLAVWILKTVPKTGYRVTTIFNEKPRYIYNEDDDLVDFEVEEVEM